MKPSISVPHDFSFPRTVRSHGWYGLLPFELDKNTGTLLRVVDVGNAKPVTVRITSAKRTLALELSRRVNKRAVDSVVRQVRHMFRVDDDMQQFYQTISAEPEFAWIVKEGAGRLLRSPTVFEDLVKMICTTNCSWALTEKMVAGLVNELGSESDDGRRTFPTADVMAQQPLRFFRDRIRSGYRAPYLKELAQRIAKGSLDVESWLTSDLPVAELLKEMKSVKGVGNYAAENLLKLLGRYDGLALDSWTRAQFARVRNQDRAANDKKISRFYARFGSWRGLVLWCDMTRHWLDPDNIGNW